jgi:hypothetical protein
VETAKREVYSVAKPEPKLLAKAGAVWLQLRIRVKIN